jgi:hypothetical protein
MVVIAGALRTGTAQGKGELMIVERPTRLTVLNRYQQNVTGPEKAVLQPYVPMVVVKRHDMLGDGFTPCMRVEINGTDFFILRDGAGRLAGEAQAGVVAAIEGTLHPGDTISVLRPGTVTLTAPGATTTVMLAAGERLVRIFSRGAQTYVRRTTGTQPYGWVELAASTEGRLWGSVRLAAALPSHVPPRVTEQVRSALSATNTKIAGIFTFLAGRGEGRKATPRWEMQPEGNLLRCTLLGGSTIRDFPESTRYLMREVQDRIAGSGFRTVAAADGFEVRPD